MKKDLDFKDYCLQQKKWHKEFRQYLSKVAPRELTQYTDFKKLTVEQKLLWLSYARNFEIKRLGAADKQKKKKKAA